MTIVFDEWIESKCLEVTQPIGTFYVGVFDSRDLVRLSRADVRRIEGEQREVETYLGIERPLNRDCPDQTDSSNHVTLWDGSNYKRAA